MMVADPMRANGIHAAGGYGPPGGGYPPGGGGYGPPGAPPGGGYGPPQGGGYGGAPPGGYGGPPPQGFGPPGGGFPPPGGPMMPGAGGEVNTTLPLVLNIVATLVCCGSGLGPVLGIVGIVFALQASNAKKMGDLDTARGKAKTSLILAIVSFVVGAIGMPLVYFGARGF